MNRLISLLLAGSGLVIFPLADSAIKGTTVLLLAGSVCLMLRRDSAATRHFVWTITVCLLIATPVLSSVLPEWRVLPSWMNSDEPTVAISSPPSVAPLDASPTTAEISELSPAMLFPESDAPEVSEQVEATMIDPGFQLAETMRLSSADTVSEVTTPIPWTTWMSGIWFFGCVLLVFRLLAAAALLRRAARRSVIVTSVFGERLGVSPPCHTLADAVILASGMRQLPGTTFAQSPDSSPANPSYRPVDTGRSPMLGFRTTTRRADAQPLAVTDVETQRLQTGLIHAMSLLGVQRPIQLLLDPQRSIPIVWGLLKTRLQLPTESVHWTDEQLQSVLLHELAHVRRRDLFVLAITQLACALHWFNQLVWIAAWRMHVERERACDDLVLASGVRASAYAEHLLNVATRLSLSKWTQACGLAMARSSSLHGRLTAVLNAKTNRRRVTKTIALISLLISCIVAVPIAMLHAGSTQSVEGAHENVTAGSSQADDSAGTDGTQIKLPDGSRQRLDWGEPVNGLRAAVMIREKRLEPIPRLAELATVYLVLQNVSDKPIRFCNLLQQTDAINPPSAENVTLSIRRSTEPAITPFKGATESTDEVIGPQATVCLDLFRDSRAVTSREKSGAVFVRILKDTPSMQVSIEQTILHAPVDAWRGTIVTPYSRAGLVTQKPNSKSPETPELASPEPSEVPPSNRDDASAVVPKQHLETTDQGGHAVGPNNIQSGLRPASSDSVQKRAISGQITGLDGSGLASAKVGVTLETATQDDIELSGGGSRDENADVALQPTVTASNKAEPIVLGSPKAIQDDSLPELQRPDLSPVTTAKKTGSSDESNVEISFKWSDHLDAAIAALRSGGSIDVARNHGMPLPEILRDAPWGASDSDGLRLALMVDTSTATETNTELIGRNFVRRRLLVHNSGDHLVEFVATNILHRFGEGEYSCVSFSSTNPKIITHLAPDAYVEFYIPSVLWEFRGGSMRCEPGIDEFPLCVRRGKKGVAMVAGLCLIKTGKEETREGASLKRLTLKSKKEHIDVALTRNQIRKNIKFADSPGDYVLSRNVKLTIEGSVDSPSEIVARVVFNNKTQGVDSAGRSIDIKLDEPYRFGWEVGTGIVWLATKSGSQRIDYSIPEVSNQLAIEPFDPKYRPIYIPVP